jgi:hypothetical protein
VPFFSDRVRQPERPSLIRIVRSTIACAWRRSARPTSAAWSLVGHRKNQSQLNDLHGVVGSVTNICRLRTGTSQRRRDCFRIVFNNDRREGLQPSGESRLPALSRGDRSRVHGVWAPASARGTAGRAATTSSLMVRARAKPARPEALEGRTMDKYAAPPGPRPSRRPARAGPSGRGWRMARWARP